MCMCVGLFVSELGSEWRHIFRKVPEYDTSYISPIVQFLFHLKTLFKILNDMTLDTPLDL